eukprot:gene8276-1477_t
MWLSSLGCRTPLADNVEHTVDWQVSLLNLQIAMERSFTRVSPPAIELRLSAGVPASPSHIAALTGRPSVLVFDRGALDPKAYVTPDVWQAMLCKVEDLQKQHAEATVSLLQAARDETVAAEYAEQKCHDDQKEVLLLVLKKSLSLTVGEPPTTAHPPQCVIGLFLLP